MREIKFRAWLESLQVMVSVHKIEFLDDGNYKIFFKNLQNGEYIDYALAPSSMISRSSAKGDRFALMQYTGVNDKNGVEIYTDFLVEYFRGGVKKLGRIKLEDGRFVITRLWDKGVNCGARLGFDWWSPDDLFEVSAEEASFLKVAGTIYDHLWALDYIASNARENPEILKDTK